MRLINVAPWFDDSIGDRVKEKYTGDRLRVLSIRKIYNKNTETLVLLQTWRLCLFKIAKIWSLTIFLNLKQWNQLITGTVHQVAWNLRWLNNMFWTSNTRLELHLIKRNFACSNLTETGKKQPCFIVSRKRDPTWAIASAGTDDWNAKNSPLQVKGVYLANLKEDNYDNLFNLLKKGRRSWRAGITLKKEIFTTLEGQQSGQFYVQ